MVNQDPRSIFIGPGDGVGANPDCPPPSWPTDVLPLEAVRMPAQGDGRMRAIRIGEEKAEDALLTVMPGGIYCDGDPVTEIWSGYPSQVWPGSRVNGEGGLPHVAVGCTVRIIGATFSRTIERVASLQPVSGTA